MKEILMELNQLSYSYEDSEFTLHDISLAIRKGEKIAVLGNNGAGKSTFFLLCNGVLSPDNGTITYQGRIIKPKKKDIMYLREKVGIVFQDPNQQLIASTVEGEISFGPMNLKLSRETVKQRIDEAIEAMELEAYRDRPPHYLSGGEKKRVSIADILAMHPEIILFDEPTASLDPAGIEMLRKVLSDLEGQEKTLLISTHDIDFAWSWADRILVFHNGTVIADGSPEDIFANEDIIKRAGIRRPYLYETALLLKQHGILQEGCFKTISDMEHAMKIHCRNT